ncbi:hypothetical protein LCC91_03240 [Tepidimonas taiwanensis]|uniref:Uncharacterized protein n=1 Tax=Tepidimonas taiwanensis TaxID=307486 RepID=A0A554X681_9BURK|nr:hypothetical protein [Tepidimonas taiwanensis]TSE31350.1 hypothetical protein Ttaiw_01524 [Tepidimonas taiwanensis]UBQ06133.1 hypothetical protein LCC91_03240 [Tepidimonas taiwanensis]
MSYVLETNVVSELRKVRLGTGDAYCAQLRVPDPRSERDALIAATALVPGMAVVARNVADFAPTGVVLVNPWQPVV